MTKQIFWVAPFLLAATLAAEGDQPTESNQPKITAVKAVRSDVSPPMRDIIRTLSPTPSGLSIEIPIGIPARGLEVRPEVEPGATPAETGPHLTPAVDLSFEGLSDDDNEDTVFFRIVPPDTNGDIGFDDEGNKIYFQAINLIWAIYDATDGSLISGPTPGNSFWAGFGGDCETTNDGDPLVLYDDDAERWVFSQFVVDQGLMCFAVSQTSDPLGSFNRYAFQIIPEDDDGNFGTADYPKMGVWAQAPASAAQGGVASQSAYTLTTRDFAAGSFNSSSTLLERDQMLVGGPAQALITNHPCVGGDCIEGQLPPHQAGPLPPFGTCPTFMSVVDSQFDDDPSSLDGVRLIKTCVDWTTIANSTVTSSFAANAINFSRQLGNGFSGCITPVPPPGSSLDCLAIFTMYRAQYRYFDGSDGNGAHASVVLNTTVNAGASTAGIHWFELRSSDGDDSWFVEQEGTYAPADSSNRWMGSIAQNADRTIALAFSIFDGTNPPSLHYATRAFDDPAGTLGSEEICHTGTGFQSGATRWGDYSSMSVDPEDDCSFWFTSEYYETSGQFDFTTRICSFKDCNLGPALTIDAPTDGATFMDIDSISFAGTGTDTEDGDISADIDWTSSIDGAIGTGAAFSITLSAGPHVIDATVTDSGGLPATDQVSITVTSPTCLDVLDIGPETISGADTRRAVTTINVTDVTVDATGDLNLISGDNVVFNDGLAVETGGQLTVENNPDPCL